MALDAAGGSLDRTSGSGPRPRAGGNMLHTDLLGRWEPVEGWDYMCSAVRADEARPLPNASYLGSTLLHVGYVHAAVMRGTGAGVTVHRA